MLDMDRDGNKKSTYITLGASDHTSKQRETNDYYATDPVFCKEKTLSNNFLKNATKIHVSICQ